MKYILNLCMILVLLAAVCHSRTIEKVGESDLDSTELQDLLSNYNSDLDSQADLYARERRLSHSNRFRDLLWNMYEQMHAKQNQQGSGDKPNAGKIFRYG